MSNKRTMKRSEEYPNNGLGWAAHEVLRLYRMPDKSAASVEQAANDLGRTPAAVREQYRIRVVHGRAGKVVSPQYAATRAYRAFAPRFTSTEPVRNPSPLATVQRAPKPITRLLFNFFRRG